MSDVNQTVGDLLGRCLRAVGATRVFGSSASGITGIPGLGHLRVDEPALAALLADALGRVAQGRLPGVALLPDRRLRLTARPGGVASPLVIDDPEYLPEAIAGWALGSTLGLTELKLDLDLDAPAPPELEPLTFNAGGQLMTLSPSLAELRIIVLAGPGVVRAEQAEALQAFAADAGVGVATSWGAAGAMPADSPYHLGTVGLQARDYDLAGFREAQMVIAVGVDPDETPSSMWAHGQVLEVEPFQLAALAYNWPDPESMPSPSALRLELEVALAPLYESAASPLNPARAARDLSVVRRGGGLIAADPGPAGFWIARAYAPDAPDSVIVPATGHRGFAVAAAMVAALDQRPAIAVTTSPLDPTTEALLELGAAYGSHFVLAEWGADVEWAEANAHRVALRSALAAPGIAHVPVPVDFNWTRTLVDVAGEVVAWRTAAT